MNIVICPDSFKDTLSAIEVAQIIGTTFKKAGHKCELIPIADGGEGTVDTLLYALEGEKIIIPVRDPLGRSIESYYGIKDSTAFLEMAQAAGIQHLSASERNPWITSSFGVGQQIKAALDQGVKKILIGIGGSGTNDCGIGLAQALGVRFLDKAGQDVELNKSQGYSGASLAEVEQIDISQCDLRLKDTIITVFCDVQNPLLGDTGASRTYGPQKGADPEMVEKLEKNMTHFADVLQRTFLEDPNFPGAGAAGGLGAGLKLFCGAKIVPGIEAMIEYLDLEEKIQNADLVVVGEGQMDWQTVFGKAPAGISRLAKKHHKPVIAIVGKVGKNYQENFEKLKIDHIFSCYGEDDVVDLEQVKKHSRENLEKLLKQVVITLPTLSSKQYQLTILSS